MPDTVAELEAKLAALPDGSGHARERVDLLNELGWQVRERGEWDRVFELARQAMDIAQAAAYKEGLAAAFRNSAFAHYMLARYKNALAEALVARQMAEELGDRRTEANALAVIALVQWSLGNYDKALEDGMRGLRIVEELADPWSLAWANTIVGGIYQSIGDHQKALDFHSRSHQIFAEQSYGLGEARSLSGLGVVYQAQGDLDRALDCHQRALEIYRRINNRIGESRALNDIGEIYQSRGELDRAQELHELSLRIRMDQANQQAQTTSMLNLGRIHLAKGQFDEAGDVLHRALGIAREIGAKPKELQAHELLSRLCELTGDYKTALDHQRAFHRLREEVFNEEESTKLKNLQIGIEVERSQREAEIHRLKNVELKEKNEELNRVLRELQEAQAQLVHSEKMAALGDLVAAIAHEINTPLGAIRTAADISLSAAERVVEAIETSRTVDELKSRRSVQATVAALRKNGKLISDASARIGHLIQSLKSFARLDQAEFQRFDLNETIRDTLAVVKPVLPARVAIVQELGDPAPILGYPAELNQVVLNLLRNAGEAIPEDGLITIRSFQENGFACIQIADTGRGIPEEQLDRLFNPGFRVEGSRVRAAMSLFTSMNIVQRHRGEIRVESEPGKGSTFTIRLQGAEPKPAPARPA